MKSQIFTTAEQSQKLLDLKLTTSTCDNQELFPNKWSLHTLINLLPTHIGHKNLVITKDFVGYMENHADDIHWPFLYKGNIYDGCIACIEWLIKEKYFDTLFLL